MRRSVRRAGARGLLALGASLVLGALAPARAAWTPEGVDLARPRLLFRAGDVALVQERLAREPYRTLLERVVDQTDSARGWALDDHTIPAEREKSKAAKNEAFLYALDRTVRDGVVEPFPTPEARRAAGDRARDYLLAMYTESRMSDVFEDDINTSEELVSYATAYDTLAGAGYPLADDDEALIRARLVALASDFYADYLGLSDVGDVAFFLQNNHRSKSGAALAVAAIALAEHTPAPGSDPLGVAEPSAWLAFGLDQVDRNLRFAYVTGDGAYSEGPYYARYGGQNHLPLLRAVDRLVGGAPGPVFGLGLPNLWRHPLWRRHQLWMADMTLPDGSMAHVDDGNVGRSYYYGMLSSLPEAARLHWAWAFGRTPWESDGSIDLAADQIVAYDDAIAPSAPAGSPTAFYFEGGNAILRESWERDAAMALVLAEHGIASEFARDRAGLGIPVAASHEQAEPGSFLLFAFGEQLALDPGYLTFPERDLVAKPRHHNVILVDGKGPVDPFTATIKWSDRAGEPPSDGQSTLSRPLDTGFSDAATVSSSYGGAVPGVAPGTAPPARVERRFHFVDHRTLVVADRVWSPTPRLFTWLLHGQGGGTSGGTFVATPTGATWEIRGARLTGAFAFDAGAPAFGSGEDVHELPDREARTHAVLRSEGSGAEIRSLLVAHPSRSADPAPEATAIPVDQGAALALHDAAAGRRLLALHRRPGQGLLVVPGAESGLRDAASDGSFWSLDADADGALRSALVDDARRLVYDGTTWLDAASFGRLGIRPEAGRAELVAENADAWIAVGGLAFAPAAADGACALDLSGALPRVALGHDRIAVLRADAGNSAPAAAADAFPRRAAPGGTLALDARASCDLDGDALEARWELVSAPAGSAWRLDDADALVATLHVDANGPYRVRLVVTDTAGASSRPAELLLFGGGACEDQVDADRDGAFDSADADCPEPGEGVACGLLGVEGVGLAAWLAARRRRACTCAAGRARNST